MDRLCMEPRRGQPFAHRAFAAEREHVRRDVAAVDVEAGVQIRDQQPTRPAGDVECGLPGLDERAEEVDLGAVEVELGPPARDEAVVPGARLAHGQAEAPE